MTHADIFAKLAENSPLPIRDRAGILASVAAAQEPKLNLPESFAAQS
jgi:hypothetical protein